MGKSTAWETGVLQLVFNNTAFAGLGDGSGLQPSGSPGSLYVGLYSSSPGVGGSQITNEISYTGYARAAVVRSAAGWTVSGGSVTNAATVSFPQCTALSATAAYVGIGTSVSGAGTLLYLGSLGSSLAISQNITPAFAAGQLTITES